MPLPSFVPIFGSGPNAFSDIGQQQANWFRTNAGIEGDNLARAHQAQQDQNNYLVQLAQWKRQDEERASQDQERAMGRDAAAQSAAEKRREFDIGTGLSEKQIAAEKDKYKWHEDIRNADEKRAMSTTENTAKFLAKDAIDYAERVKSSTAELQDATKALDTSASSVRPSVNIVFGKNKQFVPNPLATAPTSQQEAADANAKLAADKARYDQAVENYRLHLSNWNDLKKRAALAQLQIGDDGTVYSPFHDKTFGTPMKDPVTATPAGLEDAPMPSWFKPYDTNGMGLPPSIPSNDLSAGTPAIPDMQPPQSSGPAQRVIRSADGRLTMGPASDPGNIPSVFVQGAF